MRVAADVRSACDTSPCSPCDTGVKLVRSAFSCMAQCLLPANISECKTAEWESAEASGDH